VVLAYFGAINHANWAAAWTLGGDNLYPSMAGLIADYAGVRNEDVTILGVTGDAVTVRIRTTLTTGIVAVHTPTFIVQYGMIIARVPGPPPPGGLPPGGAPPLGQGG
jgi:hypothetical protein